MIDWSRYNLNDYRGATAESIHFVAYEVPMPPKKKLGREIFLADRRRHDRQSTKDQSAGDGQYQLHLSLRDKRFG